MMGLDNELLLLLAVVPVFFLLRLLYRTSLLHKLAALLQSVEDRCYVYQYYRIPQHNELLQENQLYRQVSTYLSSLVSLQDSDYANLFSGARSNDIVLHLDSNRTLADRFLSARVSWTNEKGEFERRAFVLKIKKKDKRRVLQPYLQHIFQVSDEIEQKKNEVRLFMHLDGSDRTGEGGARWRSVPFTHPATIDTVVMDPELKSKVKSDLENFLKSKQYYHRLGRVWKRSYLLHGASGTGKSSFAAALAKFLGYDIYDVDLSRVADDSDLKALLLQTTARSVILVEDLDRFLEKKSTDVSLSGVLSFMDGIVSCCGEERVMVFTMSDKDRVDQAVTRPGRVDVHVHFPLCDFSAFKGLASNYLGLKEHKLFPQVEESFQAGASLSPAHIGEIMIANRSSPTRALKTVISALQSSSEGRGVPSKGGATLTGSRSGRGREETAEPASVFCRESVHTVREFGKLYGLLKMGSRRRDNSMDLSSGEKDGSKHEGQS
ncbi:AAA-ATPase At2g46620-like [Rhodamnia argentea]|uniref:AAA-ATPase At2g46620-like n=1 Tax=Rhodamnia argentea TaxID=178133 RepID=A0A8B8QPG7_9MYRT|nr:AAA-ATPase At2g46620-like [Rhodamnia argentea]